MGILDSQLGPAAAAAGEQKAVAGTATRERRHAAALKAWDKRGRKKDKAAVAQAAVAQAAVAQAPGPAMSRGDFGSGKQYAEVELALRTMRQIKAKVLGGGVTPSYKVRLEDGTKGCFKPADGERGGLRAGISTGQMVEREVGAWEVAKLVGMDDMVAPAVERECNVPDFDGGWRRYKGGVKRGVFSRWQDGDVAMDRGQVERYDGAEDLQRAAMFDYIIGNTDRHAKNWVVSAKGKVLLIDHGLAFPEGKTYGNDDLRTRAEGKFPGSDLSRFAKPYIEKKAKIIQALVKLKLPKDAIDRVARRIDRITTAKKWSDIRGDND